MKFFNLFNNYKIDLDSNYDKIWKKLNLIYGLKEPYPKIYVISRQCNYASAYIKYNQIEINGFGDQENNNQVKICMHFFDDTSESKIYTIYLIINDHYYYTIYDAQDKIKFKNITSKHHSNLIQNMLKIQIPTYEAQI